MLTDDAAVMDVVGKAGGLRETMPAGGIHICAGTHSVAAIRALQEQHRAAGRFWLPGPSSAGQTLSPLVMPRLFSPDQRRRPIIVDRCSPRSPVASSKPVQTQDRPPRLNLPTTSSSVVPSKR